MALSGFQLAEFARLVSTAQTLHTAGYGVEVKEPYYLLSLFLPNFFGKPFQSYWIGQINPYDHVLPSLFCGISTVLLGIIALLWSAARTEPAFGFSLLCSVSSPASTSVFRSSDMSNICRSSI